MEESSGTRFSSKKTKSRMYCCVYGCQSKAYSEPTLRFHYFPKPGKYFAKIENAFGNYEKVDCRQMWQRVLKIGKDITSHMQVCSLHFKRSDYILPELGGKGKKYLKNNAVLSCNLPKIATEKEVKEDKIIKQGERTERRLRREKRLKTGVPEKRVENLTDLNYLPDQTSLSFFEEDDLTIVEKFVDFGVQVKSGDLITDFCDVITSEKELSSTTGIANFKLLNVIIDVVKLAYPKYNSSRFNIRSKIIMTFVKLKHNLSYSVLTALFKYSSISGCRRIILNMIDVLYNSLKEAIPFPDREEISRNIPVCFNNFSDVRIVLDCTLVFIQRPKKLCCQIATYSRYKSTYTIKFMTGVTPGGLISFVSRIYGGRVSDDTIFEQSEILNRLVKGESIMVDNGFRVDKLCRNKDIKLVRPPFLKEKRQFYREEALLNAEIAKARVHIERVKAAHQ